ncbi:ATP-dependent nuclease [Rhizorhabdus argentea]|uniref:ATP-dependent nuclease n=1 Tax=Rhizorhabdus argentea TaxID=1387174 RepID=UPI0030EF1D0A
MLKSIQLTNFRGFRDHAIDLTPFSLLIGQNNAGKTTLIEALRLVTIALKKAPTANFTMAPRWLESQVTGAVFRIAVDTIGFDQKSIHYNYNSDDPAIIRARYSNNSSITIAIGPEAGEIYCQLMIGGGRKLNARSQFSTTRFHPIQVMPPVGSLLDRETLRDREYLYKHINGYLSYRHIRNQMSEMPQEYVYFRNLLEETWPQLQVGDIEYGLGEKRDQFGITIREGPFVSEVGLVGSGLQAWIQTLWFLSRVDKDSTIVLDEPDVYLHADLQRKLIKVLDNQNYRQVLVATHSLEMISSVSPTEIISVTKRAPRSRPLSSNEQAQSLVERLGTNHNIQLSKLANTGRVLFVEGKDHAFLDQIAFKRGNVYYERFSKIPHFSVGGMSNWPRAAMASKVFFETSAGRVKSTLIIDRDYKSADYLDDILQRSAKDYLEVKYWSRKEIENYLLDTDLLHRLIRSRSSAEVDREDITDIMNTTVNEIGSDLIELIADSYQSENRKLALPTVMKMAKDFFAERRSNGAELLDMISGKAAISKLSDACNSKYGVAFGPMTLCRHMGAEAIPSEVASFLDAL